MSFSQTKKELLAKLLNREGISDKDWSRITKQPFKEMYPLSYSQRRLWFIERLDPGNAAYNVPVVLRITGTLNLDALKNAFRSLVERHDALRTRFIAIDGEPFQIIEPEISLKIEIEDRRDAIAGRIDEEISEEAGKSFDLEKPGLMRVRIWRTKEIEYELLLVMPHIITDGWSMSILVKHLASEYAAQVRGEHGLFSAQEHLQYTDYTEWQKTQNKELEKQTDYWRNKLAGKSETGEFPLDFERPAESVYEGKRLEIKIGGGIAEKLKSVGRRQGATPYMILAAALKILLWRYSGEEEVSIGSPAANRRRGQTDEIIGFFVNTLVINEPIFPNQTFNQYLAKIKQTILDGFANQDVPFEKLVEIIQPERRHGVNPVFQTVFNWQEEIIDEFALPGLEIKAVDFYSGLTRFDMEFHLSEKKDGEIFGYLIFNSSIYSEETCRRLIENFINLLGAITINQDSPIRDLKILTGAEKEKILNEFSSNPVVYPSEKTLKELFETQAKLRPGAVCLKFGGETLSYKEVNEKSNRVAGFLIENAIKPEEFIGLSAERSFELVIGLLGIIKAGGVYVPLDESYPVERLTGMLEATGIKTVLTGDNNFGSAFEGDIKFESIKKIVGTQPFSADPETRSQPENLAYIMFTSGSTGKPKGVSVSHKAVARLAINNDFADFGEREVFLLSAPISFDASTLEIWGSLLNGSPLTIMPPGIPTPEILENEIASSGVTTVWLTSGLFNLVMDRKPSALGKIKQLLVGGDILSSENVHGFLEMFPGSILVNGYGPTENTTFSCCYPMKSGGSYGKNIPVGFPIANSEVYILDRELNLIPHGAVGEIYVGGDGLARGYLDQPKLTAENFVPHPFSEKCGQRLYKTGDLGRFRNDGSVEFRGRKDKQVKVRGYRIELAEIEAALMKHPSIRDAAVITDEANGHDKNLIAFVAGADEENPSGGGIRQFLQKHLPNFMIPAETVFVPEIPLTENGKVDRKNLLALRKATEPKSITLPADSVEIGISKFWSEVLSGRQIGTDENFFEVGGHSLAAVKIVSKSNSHFNVEIPLQNFFENPTIAALGNLVRRSLNGESGAENPQAVTRLKNRDSYPMSYSQRRLWFIEQLQPGNAAYNVPVVLKISGDLQFDALRNAFQSIIARHESLRTRFAERGGQPFQIVEPEIKLNLEIEDFREISAEILDKEIVAETGRGFNLEQAGQLRLRVFRTQEKEYVMLLVMHHIITDGWSMGILVKHLASEYEKFTGLAEPCENNQENIKDGYDLNLQYGDYAQWQVGRLESGKLAAQIDYWKEELGDSATRSELPADYEKPPVPVFGGGQVEIIIDEDISAGLSRTARSQGATLYMILAAALKILLWRYSGEEEISVGSPAANRETEEMSEIIGFFVNTLVIKSRIEPEKTFTGFLKQVKSKALKAFANQAVPFEKLVEIIHPERDWNGVPLFQVMLILQNFPIQKIDLPGLEIAPVQSYGGKTKLDLVFNLREENNRICGNIEYAKETFKRESIERLCGQFTALLKNLSESPDAVISELKLTTGEEEKRLLDETALNDEHGGENLIHGLFEKAAEKFPSETAIKIDERSYDYDSLNNKANRVANAINSQFTGKSAIGLMIGDPVEQIAAMLGVLKSGNHFFCLDADHPAERLQQILGETEPVCLITDLESHEKQNDLLSRSETGNEKIIILDSDEKDFPDGKILFGKSRLNAFPETSPDVKISPEDLAYIVYSSGSTGKPKGIMQTHKSFSQFINWFGNEFDLAPKIKLAQWASVTYDAAYAEIFSALAFGATLCLTDPNTKNDSQKAARWIFENDISVFQTVPGFFSKMFRESEKQSFSKLKYILLAGEILPVDLVEEWLENFPDSPVLYNLYGPTETVLATFHRVKEIEHHAKSVSIGRAIGGRQILILDKQKQLCPVGVPGEIYIRSRYLSEGYFKREEETARRFTANPLTDDPDDRVFKTGDLARWTNANEIEFLGRIDSLVKIRGNRIELEEIERALMHLPQITNCAAAAAKDKAGQLQLVAFVVSDEELSAAMVRKLLAQKLPVYMLPSTILFVEKIPLTASGKTDRMSLISQIPEMPESLHQGYVAPETELEKEIAGLWENLLEIEKIGLDDDFFQLGGHSLLAVQIVNKVRRDYETEITLRSFLMNPTVRQLGENITLSRQFSGTDPIRLAAFVEQVKSMSDEEVAKTTKSLLDSKDNGTPLIAVIQTPPE